MNFRVLILDDNHSFIDLIKLKLEEYPFQFDSVFRYEQANKMIKKQGCFFSTRLIKEVQKATLLLKDWADNSINTSFPKLSRELMVLDSIVNPDGYLMMIIEDKVEGFSQGIQYIQNIISTYPNFQNKDFLLFANVAVAKKSLKGGDGAIPIFLKDIRNEAIYQFIQSKIREVHHKVQELETLLQNFLQLREKLQKQFSKKTKKTAKISLNSKN